MDTIWAWGVALILALQDSGARVAPLWRGLSVLGDEIFFLLLMPLIFWCVSPRLGVRLSLVLLLGTALNTVCKLAFVGPRPFWYSDQVRALTAETSFGLPSAHAQNAVGVWGIIAAEIRRRWAWAVALLLATLIGVSRLALGVHFPTDVLAGWALGALTLGAFMAWADLVWRRVSACGLAQQIGTSFLASLLLVALPAVAFAMQSHWQIPAQWAQNAARALPNDPIAPLSLDTAFTVGGTWFGFTAGLLLLRVRGGFDASGPIWQRGARLLVGLAVVLVIWAGLGAIFSRDATLLAGLLRYLRYTILGGWISLGAPLLFVRVGLAHAPQPVVAPALRG